MAEQEADEAGEVRLWLDGYNPAPSLNQQRLRSPTWEPTSKQSEPGRMKPASKPAEADAASGPAVIGRKRASEAIKAIIKSWLWLRHNNDPSRCPSPMTSSESGRLR